MNKNGLFKHIEAQLRMHTVFQVAEKCGITVPQLVDITKGAASGELMEKAAKALNYRESSWNIVRTTHNYRTVETVWNDAKAEGMWFCISNPAGSGKSETLEDLFNNDTSGRVKLITAEEVQARTFLRSLVMRIYGITNLETGNFRGKSWDDTQSHYKNASYFLDMICDYFNSVENPILVIDEADKLRESAMRQLIPLFNRTQDRLGVILSGTENLEREIRRGVRLAHKGYDELESRFGRNYIHLRGSSYADVSAICQANGVNTDESVEFIWNELPKVDKPVMVTTPKGKVEKLVPFVEDMRRLKRLIKREVLINKNKKAA